MSDKYPKISVITVTYNNAVNLEATIQSVTGQDYPNLEYIIIDGGSTDNTKDVIGKYEKNVTKWVSEKDKGIYDAMNKGISIATGEFINFMNGGDLYYDNQVLKTVAGTLSETKGLGILYGNTECFSNELGIKYIIKDDFKISNVWTEMKICHQSMFFNKTVFSLLGMFDLKYKLAADYEHLLRFIKSRNEHNLIIKYINANISRFKLYGYTSDSYHDTISEMKAISVMYYGNSIYKRLYFTVKYIKYSMLKFAERIGALKHYRVLKYGIFRHA